MNITNIINQITNREYIYILVIFILVILTSLFTISTITKNPKRSFLLSITTLVPTILFIGGYILIKWKIDQAGYSLYQTLFFLLLVIHFVYIVFLSQTKNKNILYLFPITFIVLYAPITIFYQTILVPLILFGITFFIDSAFLLLISVKSFKK
jgi:hypothetical protein